MILHAKYTHNSVYETLYDIQTCLHKRQSLSVNSWCESLRLIKVLKYEDVGGKQDHVLLPTAGWHGQELIESRQGRTHDITYVQLYLCYYPKQTY